MAVRKGVLLFLHIVLLTSACTRDLWVLSEAPVIDRSEPKVVNSDFEIRVEKTPDRIDATMEFGLYQIREVEYPLRIQKERFLQRYKPRWISWVLGIGAASAGFYLARSASFEQSSEFDNRSSNMYFYSSLGLFAGSFLLQKPIGTPISTGEVVLLQQQGTSQLRDTISATQIVPTRLDIDLSHPNIPSTTISALWNSGSYSIDLATAVEWRPVSRTDPPPVEIWITSESSSKSLEIPIEQFMTPYVYITKQSAEIYSDTTNTAFGANMFTELSSGSRLRYLSGSASAEYWKVELGPTPVFVRQADVRIRWEFGIVETTREIVRGKRIPYGRLEVEKDLPQAASQNSGALAILVSNTLKMEKDHAEIVRRDNRMMSNYLETTLGVDEDRIFFFPNDTSFQWLDALQFETNQPFWATDTAGPMYLYYSGPSHFTREKGLILGSEDSGNSILQLVERSDENWFSGCFLILETAPSTRKEDEGALYVHLQDVLREMDQKFGNVGIFLAAEPNTDNFLYVSAPQKIDFRHSMFTYMWCDALRQGYFTVNALKNFLERELPFKSRRLHEKPQRAMVFSGDFDTILP